MLVIRRIHVAYRLAAPEEARAAAERAHAAHHMHCPVYRTLHRCIEITTSLELGA